MKRVFVLLLLAASAWTALLTAQAPASAPKPAAPKPAAAAPKPAAAAAGGRLVEITAGSDSAGKFMYTPASISAKPGELLHLRLKAVAPMAMPKMAMSHNFVLLKPTTKIGDFQTDATNAGFPANFIPASHKADILASMPLVAIGETGDVTFKAPAVAGSYPFICTFPAHAAGGMKGTLIVK